MCCFEREMLTGDVRGGSSLSVLSLDNRESSWLVTWAKLSVIVVCVGCSILRSVF